MKQVHAMFCVSAKFSDMGGTPENTAHLKYAYK